MEDKPEKEDGLTWRWRPQRRHKFLDDPLFEEGDSFIGDSVKHFVPVSDMSDEEERKLQDQESFSCQLAQCGQKFTSVADYEMHYSTIHRNVCSVCHRHYANSHLLSIHLAETHDPLFSLLAEKKNMYSCLVEMCSEKFPSPKARKRHLVDVHKYPPNFRFHQNKEQKKKNPPKEPVVPSGTMETDPVMDRLQPAPSGEGDQKQSSVSSSGRRFVYNVPKTICFGQGSQRGFSRPRGRGRGRKHWHQQGQTAQRSKVNIEEVDMADLVTALGPS